MRWCSIFSAMMFLSIVSCSEADKGAEVEEIEIHDDLNEKECGYEEVNHFSPILPAAPEGIEVEKYSGEMSRCITLPDKITHSLVLNKGCYSGCLNIIGNHSIKGEGTHNTLIICDDESRKGVIEISAGSFLELKNVSLNGRTRGIYVNEGGNVIIENTAIYNVVLGGINVCGTEPLCNSSVSVSKSYIGDISEEKKSKLSYGISMGVGRLDITDSILKGFNSFAIALWGENALHGKVIALIKNTKISDVIGGEREYEGHGIYIENKADVVIRRSMIRNASATFLFASGSSGASVKISDVAAKNIIEAGKEQGGFVFEGMGSVVFERVLIKNSRGSGIFVNNSKVYGEDISIDGVSSDNSTHNGFGLMLFDGSNTAFKRIAVTNAQTAGILVDGKCKAELEDFEVSGTRSDSGSGEYGIGIAVQDNGELSLKNGVVLNNRESGIMVINSKVKLKNVDIKGTLPRECVLKDSCFFAPGVSFGHGISLYGNSELDFDNINIIENNNGMNIENSKLKSAGEGKVNFLQNINAVNAWNLKDFNSLEKELVEASFCGNKSVFTTDVQPVREDL